MELRQRKLTLEITGEHNRRLVFQLMRRLRTSSRQQIADMTSLHRSTLSKIMSEFLERKLVREIGTEIPTVKRVGKRRIQLEICGEIGWTIGVGINLGWARMVWVDAAGKVRHEHRFDIPKDINKVPEALKQALDEQMAQTSLPPGRLYGAGVATPGITNSDTGVLIYSEYFKVRNFPLADSIRRQLNMPVVVDNDARLEALAHLNQPDTSSGDDFVFLYGNYEEKDGACVFTEFGSAIVIGAQLYRGAHRGAGELSGRLRFPPSPPLQPDDLQLLETPDGPMNDRLEALAEHLAPYAATLAGYIDPVSIVLGGVVDWYNRAFRQHLQARVNEQVQPWFAGREIRVEAAQVPAAGSAYGAALLALDQVPVTELTGER